MDTYREARPDPDELVEEEEGRLPRPRFPFLKGPFPRRTREGDLAAILVVHSDPED